MSYWKLGKKERIETERETECVCGLWSMSWIDIFIPSLIFSRHDIDMYTQLAIEISMYLLNHTHLHIHNTHTAPDASFRDLLLAIRKDEATHREVNHTFASLKEHDYNPYVAHQQYLSDVISKKQKK